MPTATKKPESDIDVARTLVAEGIDPALHIERKQVTGEWDQAKSENFQKLYDVAAREARNHQLLSEAADVYAETGSRRARVERKLLEGEWSEDDVRLFDEYYNAVKAMPEDKRRAMKKAAEDAATAKQYGEDLSMYPPIYRDVLLGIQQGRGDIASLLSRPFSGATADEINRAQQVAEQGAAQADQGEVTGKFGQYVRGASRSVYTSGALSPLGSYGIIAGFGLSRANQAITEAEDAGRSGWEKWGYVGRAGVIEGGIAAAFQAVGAGGFESVMGGASQLTKGGLKEFLKQTGFELIEENLTEIVDQYNQIASGIDPGELDWPKALQILQDTTIQTVLAMGAGTALKGITAQRALQDKEVFAQQIAQMAQIEPTEAIQLIETAAQESEAKNKPFEAILGREIEAATLRTPEGVNAWAQGNLEQARGLLEKGQATRKDFEKAGLPRMPGEQRQQFLGILQDEVGKLPAPAEVEAEIAAEAQKTQEGAKQALVDEFESKVGQSLDLEAGIKAARDKGDLEKARALNEELRDLNAEVDKRFSGMDRAQMAKAIDPAVLTVKGEKPAPAPKPAEKPMAFRQPAPSPEVMATIREKAGIKKIVPPRTYADIAEKFEVGVPPLAELDQMVTPDLRAEAKRLGLKPGGLKREALLRKIREARAGEVAVAEGTRGEAEEAGEAPRAEAGREEVQPVRVRGVAEDRVEAEAGEVAPPPKKIGRKGVKKKAAPAPEPKVVEPPTAKEQADQIVETARKKAAKEIVGEKWEAAKEAAKAEEPKKPAEKPAEPIPPAQQYAKAMETARKVQEEREATKQVEMRKTVQKVLETGTRPAKPDGKPVPWSQLEPPPGEYAVTPEPPKTPKKPKDSYVAMGQVVGEEGRYALGGVLIEETKKGKVAVGTDGRKLVVMPYEGDLEPGIWAKHRPNVEKTKIEGQYPKYQDMIPDAKKAVASLEITDELAARLNTAKLASKMGDEVKIKFRFTIGDDTFYMAAYVLDDALTSLRSAGFKPTTIESYGPEKPLVVRTDNKQALAVIAPIRVKEGAPTAFIDATPEAAPKPKPSAPSGVAGFPETAAETVEAAMPTEPPKKLVQAADVIGTIKKTFGIPIRGKATFNKRALGWFDPSTTEIRQRNVRDITVAVHEIGHHIDRLTDRQWSKHPPSKAIAKELVQLGKDLYGTTKPPGGYKSEGWAEFIREYLTNADLTQRAPELLAWFTDEYLPAHRELAKKLHRVEEMVSAFRMQGAEARVKAFRQPLKRDWSVRRLLGRMAAWNDTKWRDMNLVIAHDMKRAGIDRSTLKPSEDPLLMATAYSMSADGMARSAALEGTTNLAGQLTGESLRDALLPVTQQGKKTFDNWKSYVVASRALLLHDRGIEPGISRTDAEYVVNKHDSPEFRDTTERVTQWSRRVLQLLVESGKIGQADFDKIADLNPIYVPFMRQFEEGEISAGKPKGGGKGLYSIKGSGREIHDPVDALVEQARRLTHIAMSTDVMRALVRAGERFATPGRQPGISHLISEVPAPREATTFSADQIKGAVADMMRKTFDIDPVLDNWEQMLTVFTTAGEYHGKDNIVALDIDGTKRWFEVSPELYKLVRGLNTRQNIPGIVGKITRAAVGLQRLGATGLNPAFGLVRNLLRDAQTAAITSDYAKGGPLASFSGLLSQLTDKETARRYRAMGVDLAGWIGQDKRGVRKLAKRVAAPGHVAQAMVTVTEPIQALREIFSVTETGPRLAEFSAALKHAQKEGMSEKDATILAAVAGKDVTVNFSRAGEYGRVANEVLVFFNPAVQSVDKLGRSFLKNPVRTTLRGGVYLTLASMIQYYRNRDEEWWKDLPSYEKWNYIHIRIPWTDTILRIPLPFEAGAVFGALPVAAVDGPESFMEALEQAGHNAIPELTPSILAPLFEVAQNKDWAGRPIIPKGQLELLPEDQYGAYTSDAAKTIGQMTGWSPLVIDHLVNSYTGGLFRRVASATEHLAEPGYYIEDLHNLPVVGTLFLREGTTKIVNDFYERSQKLVKKRNSGKATLEELGWLARADMVARDELRPLWDRVRVAKGAEDAEVRAEAKEARKSISDRIKEFAGEGEAELREFAIGKLALQLGLKTPSKRAKRYVELLQGLSKAEIKDAMKYTVKKSSDPDEDGKPQKQPLFKYLYPYGKGGKKTAFGKRLTRVYRLLNLQD